MFCASNIQLNIIDYHIKEDKFTIYKEKNNHATAMQTILWIDNIVNRCADPDINRYNKTIHGSLVLTIYYLSLFVLVFYKKYNVMASCMGKYTFMTFLPT